jgi:hypothetical protein
VSSVELAEQSLRRIAALNPTLRKGDRRICFPSRSAVPLEIMSATRDDVRYALRSMRANPGFTAVAIVSLALGIGVNTAIFSLVDRMLLWSVPARDPSRLVRAGATRFRK